MGTRFFLVCALGAIGLFGPASACAATKADAPLPATSKTSTDKLIEKSCALVDKYIGAESIGDSDCRSLTKYVLKLNFRCQDKLSLSSRYLDTHSADLDAIYYQALTALVLVRLVRPLNLDDNKISCKKNLRKFLSAVVEGSFPRKMLFRKSTMHSCFLAGLDVLSKGEKGVSISEKERAQVLEICKGPIRVELMRRSYEDVPEDQKHLASGKKVGFFVPKKTYTSLQLIKQADAFLERYSGLEEVEKNGIPSALADFIEILSGYCRDDKTLKGVYFCLASLLALIGIIRSSTEFESDKEKAAHIQSLIESMFSGKRNKKEAYRLFEVGLKALSAGKGVSATQKERACAQGILKGSLGELIFKDNSGKK